MVRDDDAKDMLLPIFHVPSRMFSFRLLNQPLIIRSATWTFRASAATKLLRVERTTMTSRRSVSSFQAWRVDQLPDKSFQGSEQTLPMSELAADTPNAALIKVTHSSLNYKDALSASGNKGVTRKFPHTPGIDAVGTIVETGENVIVTGYDLGMNTDGGFGEYICVPRDWCVLLPKGWTPRQSMVMGTAGLTAGLCVEKLLRMGATPQQGKVAVTGASGSVGSVAVEILSNLDFEVTAISGKQPGTSGKRVFPLLIIIC